MFYLEIGRTFNPVLDWGDIAPAIGVGTRRDRRHAHEHRARRDLARSHPGHRRDHRFSDSHHYRGRPASPRRGSRTRRPHSRLGAVRGPVTATRPGIPGRLGQHCRAGRHGGARHPDSAPWPGPFEQVLRGSDPEASVPASNLLAGLRGKDVIVAFVESLRAGRRPGHELLRRRRRRPEPGHRLAGPRGWSTRSAWTTSPASAGSAGSPTPPCSRGCGSTLYSGMPNLSAAAGSPSATPSTRLAGAPSTTPPLTTSTGRSARPFTTSARSSRPARRLGSLPRPDLQLRLGIGPDLQYTLAAFQRLELTPRPQARDGPDRPGSPRTRPGPRCRSWWPWSKVGNGSIIRPDARARARPRSPSWATPASSARPLASRSSTRCRPSPHGSPSSTTQTWCSSCSATSSLVALSAAPGPTTWCRSRSSPATLSVFRQIASWRWLGRARSPRPLPLRLSQWTPSATSSFGAFSTVSPQAASAHGSAAP